MGIVIPPIISRNSGNRVIYLRLCDICLLAVPLAMVKIVLFSRFPRVFCVGLIMHSEDESMIEELIIFVGAARTLTLF